MQYHCHGSTIESNRPVKFTKNDIMFFSTKINKLTQELKRLKPHIQFFIDNLNDEIKIINVSREIEFNNMYKNYNDYLPKKNDILVYKYLDSSLEDLKTYIELSRSDILKYSTQFTNKSFDTIRGNVFGVNGAVWEGNNLIYNYCSNNVSFYNNKKYAYNYKNSDEQYYMVDKIKEENYTNKKRINTRELEEQERRAKKLIEKLTSGVNIVGFQNNKNLNINRPQNIFDIFSGDNKHFVLEWKNKSNSNDFKSGLLINIKTNDYNKLNINITTDIFEEHDIIKKIDEIAYKFESELRTDINLIEPHAKFTPDKQLFNQKLISEEGWNGVEEITENFDSNYSEKVTKCKWIYDLDPNYTTYNYNLVHEDTYMTNHLENKFDKYSNDLNNLLELYIRKIIPIYSNLDIHKYNWKIEFDGVYEPDITEFHLKSVSLNKYLINIKPDNNNIYNILGWSERIIKGSGWKFKESNIVGRINFNTTLLENYKSDVKNIIKDKFKEIYINKTLKLINDKTTYTEGKISNAKQNFDEHKIEQRINKIKNIGPDGEGCHIFSPNVGENGKFLKYKYNNFSYTNDINDSNGSTLFYISKAAASKSSDIKNDDEILIKNRSKKNNLSYIDIDTKKNYIDLKWTGSEKKWTIKMDVELQLNSNRNNILQEIPDQKEINKVHTLIKSNSISIKVGDYNFKAIVPNIYKAIKEFKKVKKVKNLKNNDLSGNMWISKGYIDGDSTNFVFTFYKDNPGDTTISNCWLITNNDLRTTKKEMLRFETSNKKNGIYLPPQWKARRRFYLNKLESRLKDKSQTSDCMGVPISVYLSNGKYLSSNRLDNFVWNNEKKEYSSSFYIISKNDDSNFIKNYNKNNINQEQEIFNFLYNIDSSEPFIIYSDIKNISYNPEILFINDTKKTNTYKHGDGNLGNIQNSFKNSIQSDANLQKQLWKVTNRNTQILQVNETLPTTKYITFNLDIISYNDNLSFSSNLNQAIEQSYTTESRNTENQPVIRVYYIIEHPVYTDYYIFQNISNNRFLSIYNKECKNTDTWDFVDSNQQCVGNIGTNLGIFWNNQITEPHIYENKIIPEELAQILTMEKIKNTFVFKVISNELLDFEKMWHSDRAEAQDKKNALDIDKIIWDKQLKIINDDIVYLISNFKNYKNNDSDEPKQYILKYEGLFTGHNIMNLDFIDYKNKYLFKIKNLITDPTYKIRNIQDNKYILFKATIKTLFDTNVFEDVKIYYILDGKYRDHYAIQNKNQENKFLRIEESGNQDATINFEGNYTIEDILNNNPQHPIQNQCMFKIHIDGIESEIYVKNKEKLYVKSKSISSTRNIFINDNYALSLLSSNSFKNNKARTYGVLQYIRVRYTEQRDNNSPGHNIWFDYRETPIFEKHDFVTLWVHSVRRDGNYVIHLWKHGYDVPYGRGTTSQLYTDESSNHLRNKPNNATDYLGYGRESTRNARIFRKDDILLFWPEFGVISNRKWLENTNKDHIIRNGLNYFKHTMEKLHRRKHSWLEYISKATRRKLALDITNNEDFYKDK